MKDFLSFPFHVSLGLPLVEFGAESHPLDDRYPTQVLIHCEVYKNKSLKTHKQKYLYTFRASGHRNAGMLSSQQQSLSEVSTHIRIGHPERESTHSQSHGKTRVEMVFRADQARLKSK